MKGDLVGLRSGDSAVEIRRERGKFSSLVYPYTPVGYSTVLLCRTLGSKVKKAIFNMTSVEPQCAYDDGYGMQGRSSVTWKWGRRVKRL